MNIPDEMQLNHMSPVYYFSFIGRFDLGGFFDDSMLSKPCWKSEGTKT